MKVGAAFGENIRTEKVPRRRNTFDFGNQSVNFRGFLFPLTIVVLMIILLGRLFLLQIIQGAYYRGLADSNRIQTTIIHAPRGIIFDRTGLPLTYNTPGFRETINGKTEFISSVDAIALLAKGKKDLEIDSLRSYPTKDQMGHVVGYIGQISKDELQTSEFSNYRGDDVVGKMGIEKEYEELLKGTDGKKLSEINAVGKTIKDLGQTDPIPGQNITLTIDSKLQDAAYKGMKNAKRGAVIVSKPNGEILAMVSKPSFDPNVFTMPDYNPCHSGLDPESSKCLSIYQSISQILTDGNATPLLNRTISGTYPPGSTFKLVVAASGLENKLIDENYEVTDTGIINIGKFSFSNWYYSDYGKTDGQVNVVKGITRSNDIFFYKVGELVGVDKISKTANQFGVGNTLGIDLPNEAKGLVPTKDWKKKVIGDNWYLGDDYHYAIGQGYLLVTPLQVNAWTQAIANGGTLYQPHLLKNNELRIMNKGLLSEKNLDLIRKGMIGSCQPGGEAYPLYNFSVKRSASSVQLDGRNFFKPYVPTGSAQIKDQVGVSIACKTGSAQHGNDNEPPHGWITLFAPAYNPQIIVTVLVESSGMGSDVAAPVAKIILEEWFSR